MRNVQAYETSHDEVKLSIATIARNKTFQTNLAVELMNLVAEVSLVGDILRLKRHKKATKRKTWPPNKRLFYAFNKKKLSSASCN